MGFDAKHFGIFRLFEFVKHLKLVDALNELREEICGFGILGLLPVAHNVALLFPDLDCFLQFHLTLLSVHSYCMKSFKDSYWESYLDDQHINNTYIGNIAMLVELFAQLATHLLNAHGYVVVLNYLWNTKDLFIFGAGAGNLMT